MAKKPLALRRRAGLLVAAALLACLWMAGRLERSTRAAGAASGAAGDANRPARRHLGDAAGSHAVGRSTAAAVVAAEDAAAANIAAADAIPYPVVTSTAAAVTAAAQVHGFVRKQAPLDPRLWHPEQQPWREAQRKGWLEQRQARLAAGAPPPPLPLLMDCHVFVNHAHHAIFLRHAKTASSSLLCHFSGRCEGGQRQANTTFVPLEALSGAELERVWRDYFVFTFVRSPYQRAVSSYRMMMRHIQPASAEGYGWNDFCADPAGLANRCLADAGCAQKGAEFVYIHIQPQQPCLAAAGGGWAADFIGRVERIDEDLSTVLAELQRRRPRGAPPVSPLRTSLQNVNGRGCNETAEGNRPAAKEQYCDPASYYEGPHAACLEQIESAYRLDVDALQFGPEQPGG